MASTGLMTGLMGYSLKKEMFGDALFYREIQTFSYEVYSLDMPNLSPSTIHNRMMSEFTNRYSGDINVKVFALPTDYTFPNDSIRVGKFNVEVQVRSIPSLTTWMPELSTNYYQGLDSTFFQNWGVSILDFKETHDFEIGDNGVQNFGHSISFGMLTGSKSGAAGLAAYVFGKDSGTTFGINVMPNSIAQLGDSGIYQNYYTETYDTIRNQYSFSRKREVLPSGVSTYVFNLNHNIELKDDGIIDVVEKGNVKGKLNFPQAQQGAESLIINSYTRCNNYYQKYAPFANATSTPITNTLIQSPRRTSRTFNRPAITVDYEINYTNSPLFNDDGTTTEETFDINDISLGVIDVKHSLNFTRNKRSTAANTFDTMIAAGIATSPDVVDAYLLPYYPVGTIWPIKLIKREFSWPLRDSNGARVLMQYNNHPKYFPTINGVGFYMLEYKVQHQQPVDITTEYKVINRPSHLSVINYAYQTEKGKIVIVVDAGIGRNPDEFITSFRNDLGGILYALYRYAAELFFLEFKNVVPLAFTYYLSDVKYSYGSDNGMIQLTTSFDYTLKKYIG